MVDDNAVHGLQLAPEPSQVLVSRPAPHAPIRTINAHQLAQLTHQYNTSDVEDSVLFPFLHGLEGNNAAQNSFFNHARRGGRAQVPRYRGLLLVRVDEQGYELDVRGNVRNPAIPATATPAVPDDDDDSLDGLSDDDDQCAMAVESTTFMHPVAERTTAPNSRQPPHQLNTQNVPPLTSSESASMNSASTESMSIANYFASPAGSAVSLSQTSPPTTPNSSTDCSKGPFLATTDRLDAGADDASGAPSTTEDDDQLHRNRTPVPPPAHDAPRRPSHVLTCSFHPDEILTQSASGPVFLNPRIPEGISLRNFGIQVPIYATLSDIVVYSPKGRTRSAMALAERCKQAIEAKAVERGFVAPPQEPGGEPTMSPAGVVYNVYVLTDPFEALEKQYPHLVWINSKGDPVGKIEFMEREKEEMRNLTRASEISEGVYLGNTADVPLLSNPPTPIPSPNSSIPVYPGYDPFDASNNMEGYDICIECHDMAAFPTKGNLAGVEERLRALDEQWRQRVRDTQFLKDQEREQEQRKQQELARKEELRKRREAEMDLDMDMDADEPTKESDVKVIDDGLGLRLDMPPLSPPVHPGQLTNGVPLSPRTSDLFSNLAVSGSEGTTPKPNGGGSTPIPVPAGQHVRSRSIGASLSSMSSFGQSSPIGTPSSRKGTRGYPPRPPPNATQVIHLAFPSSPPATPQTLSNMIPFLQFLHNLTHPRPPSADELSFNSGSLGRSAGMSSSGRARSPSLTSNGSSPGQPLRTSMTHSRSGSLTALSPRTRSATIGFSGLGGSPSSRSIVRQGIQLSRPMKILLHAGDGYTETSVLALSYLMLAGNKTLPEAYLELQVQKARSFFVYSMDVGVLRRVEQKLKMERERERERMAASIAATAASVGASSSSSPKTDGGARGVSPPPPTSSNRWRWGVPSSWRSGSLSSAGVSLLNGSGMFSNPAGGSVGNVLSADAALFTPPEEMKTSQPLGGALAPSQSDPMLAALPSDLVAENPSPPPPSGSHSHQRVVPSQRPPSLSQSYGAGQVVPTRRARASTSPLLPSFLDHETWFNDTKFDGSFPSRVLPFLYLGNLAHAGNAYMLHALGITHVVSVGECALIPPQQGDACTTYGHNQSGAYSVTASTTGGPSFMYNRPGSGSLWVEEKEGRIKVLDIKGVCDDGIDSLRPQILPTVEWIDKARAEGGKVLVHCRVGVSRSATVTIAYVMHHLKCTLVDAYLMVRSRRLSVLIQPNMRLLYNLCGWEIELARRRAAAEARDIELSQGRQLSWPFLAREVHILNERYLS